MSVPFVHRYGGTPQFKLHLNILVSVCSFCCLKTAAAVSVMWGKRGVSQSSTLGGMITVPPVDKLRTVPVVVLQEVVAMLGVDSTNTRTHPVLVFCCCGLGSGDMDWMLAQDFRQK